MVESIRKEQGDDPMGTVYANIELFNDDDLALSRRGYLSEAEVRHMDVRVLVDSGAATLVINDNIRTQLGLETKEQRTMRLADDSLLKLDVVGPVEIRFENRRSMIDAVVLPNNTEPLLGAMPMQDMDVLIDPQRHRLIVNPDHPILAGGKLK
jgi:clan AA aspartic protease